MRSLIALVLLAVAAPAWAINVAESNTTLTAASSASVATNRTNRAKLLIQNIGAGDAYCCRAATCVASAGTLLVANGGTWELNDLDDVPQGAISCISTPGTTIHVDETYR